MLKDRSHLYYLRRALTALVILTLLGSSGALAERHGWQRQQVDWRMTGGERIKAVRYPPERPVPGLIPRKIHKPKMKRKKISPVEAASRIGLSTEQLTGPVFANVIDSPPIAGLASWIVVAVTDEREGEFELDAVPQTSVVGNYLTSNPESDYAIGIFDTGASAHIMGNTFAVRTGLFDAGLVTSAEVELLGATGSVFAWLSHPLGIFIDGLGVIEPNGLVFDTSGMVGETNVSIIVGKEASPDLPTAIGSPLSVYFAASFRNDYQITIPAEPNQLTAPNICFYDLSDPCMPTYSNTINLQLRPSDAVSVQYFPCIEPLMTCPDGDGAPISPSVITGFLPTQSLFFFPGVDLAHGGNNAYDKPNFIFDTGAQVTIISSIIAARLGLDPGNPDFEVEIFDITGEITIQPGFYIDLLEIPALGEWLSFTNVPVVMIDVTSPEGGYLDGIIGANLLVDYNFVFRGGGLPGLGAARLQYEPIDYFTIADIAPGDGDGTVDLLDLSTFALAWLAIPTSPNWNPKCDLAPQPIRDGKIDFADFAVLSEYWRESIAP